MATTIDKLWQHRDHTVAMLAAADEDRKPGLRAAVMGVEKIIRAVIENRGGVEVSKERLLLEASVVVQQIKGCRKHGA